MPLQVRLPDELIVRIDKLRDPLVPREAYIRALVEEVVGQRENNKRAARRRARKR